MEVIERNWPKLGIARDTRRGCLLSAQRLGGVVVVWILFIVSGCSREYYREQADADVHALVAEKSTDPRWDLSNFNIAIDPRSRYYDDNDPDYPPMPPDDPASHVFMHCVDGMHGWHWHKTYGSVSTLENTNWREQLGKYMQLTEDGKVKLGLEDTVRLAMIQSPGWQQQLETIYLSALTVSTERFTFDVQYFGGNNTLWAHLGPERRFAGESNTLTTETDLQARRTFAAAGQFLVGFANTFVWEFAGPNLNTTANSLINFSLIQPLLRGAGQDVELERLTRVERGLLANLRAYERYRKGFFTNIAVGDSGPGTNGPQATGGLFGGTGLSGFTGTGGGGFGIVGGNFGRGAFFGGGGGVGGGGTAGAAGVAGGGAGNVGGFIGLLQQLQNLRNQRDSLDAQLRAQGLLEAQLEAGQIDIIQVDRLRQAILTAQANMLATQNSFDNAVQSFIRSTFALPPDLPVELDDSFIRPFQFIDRRVTEVQNDLTGFIDRFGELPQQPSLEQLRQALDEFEMLRQRATSLFGLVQSDLVHLEEQAPERELYMNDKQKQEFRDIRKTLPETLAELNQRFEATGRQLDRLRAGLDAGTREQTANGIVELHTELSAVVQEASLVQARARVEAVVLKPFRMSVDEAVAIARANRLDWMNARASLVDSWRLVQFNADRLQSDLTIVASGDIGTLDRNIVKFRDENASLRLGVQFDAPLTRLEERNTFRAQLISYQQDRRQLIQFEDQVRQSMDQVLRQLEQLELNQEIQRQAVVTSIRRVDQVLESLREPPAPALPGQPAAGLGETIAENLLSALEDLGGAQSNFMSVWLAHYAARMGLMRDLGIMRLDENNMWIDEPLEDALRAAQQNNPYPTPPAAPDAWLRELEDDPQATDRVVSDSREGSGRGTAAPVRWLEGMGSRLSGMLHGRDRSGKRRALDRRSVAQVAQGSNTPAALHRPSGATPPASRELQDEVQGRPIVPTNYGAAVGRPRVSPVSPRAASPVRLKPAPGSIEVGPPAAPRDVDAEQTRFSDPPVGEPNVSSGGADADYRRWIESRARNGASRPSPLR